MRMTPAGRGVSLVVNEISNNPSKPYTCTNPSCNMVSPRKFNIDTKHGGLKFKCISFQIWLIILGSNSLNFKGVTRNTSTYRTSFLGGPVLRHLLRVIPGTPNNGTPLW